MGRRSTEPADARTFWDCIERAKRKGMSMANAEDECHKHFINPETYEDERQVIRTAKKETLRAWGIRRLTNRLVALENNRYVLEARLDYLTKGTKSYKTISARIAKAKRGEKKTLGILNKKEKKTKKRKQLRKK